MGLLHLVLLAHMSSPQDLAHEGVFSQTVAERYTANDRHTLIILTPQGYIYTYMRNDLWGKRILWSGDEEEYDSGINTFYMVAMASNKMCEISWFNIKLDKSISFKILLESLD